MGKRLTSEGRLRKMRSAKHLVDKVSEWLAKDADLLADVASKLDNPDITIGEVWEADKSLRHIFTMLEAARVPVLGVAIDYIETGLRGREKGDD